MQPVVVAGQKGQPPLSQSSYGSRDSGFEHGSSRPPQALAGSKMITKEFEDFIRQFKQQLIDNKATVATIGDRVSRTNDGYCPEQDFYSELERFQVKLYRNDAQLIQDNINFIGNLMNYKQLDELVKKTKLGAPKSKSGFAQSSGRNKSTYDEEDGSDADDAYGQGRGNRTNTYEDEEEERSLLNSRTGSKMQKKNSFKKRQSKAVQKIPEYELNESFQQLCNEIKLYIRKEDITVQTMFRKFDLDNDEYISMKEFSNGLEMYFSELDFSNQDLKFAVFQKFDEDKDFQISSFEFQKCLYGKQGDIDIKPLLAKIKKNMDIKDEEQIKLYFQKIDANQNGLISWDEFKNGMELNWGRDLDYNQKRAVFKYFDKDNREEISYEKFCAVLMEGQLDKNAIKKKIQEEAERQQKSLSALHTYYAGDKNYMSQQDLRQLTDVRRARPASRHLQTPSRHI